MNKVLKLALALGVLAASFGSISHANDKDFP